MIHSGALREVQSHGDNALRIQQVRDTAHVSGSKFILFGHPPAHIHSQAEAKGKT